MFKGNIGKFWVEHQSIGVIIIGAIGILLMVFLLVLPAVKNIEKTANSIQEKKLDEQIHEERLNNLSDTEETWSVVEDQREALNVILSSENEIGFIESIEAIASKSGNAISLKIGENADPKEIAKIKKSSKNNAQEKGILDEVSYTNYFPMQINLKGDYLGLVNFVHLLENSHFYVNIISLDIKKEEINSLTKENVFSREGEDSAVGSAEILNTNINAIVYTKN